MTVGRLTTSAVRNRDLAEADKAWHKFKMTRYFTVTKVGPSTIVEAVYPIASREILEAGRRTFVEEFMHCRGWRRLPGSEEWV